MLQERCDIVNELDPTRADAMLDSLRSTVGYAIDSLRPFERLEAPLNSTIALVALSV